MDSAILQENVHENSDDQVGLLRLTIRDRLRGELLSVVKTDDDLQL